MTISFKDRSAQSATSKPDSGSGGTVQDFVADADGEAVW